MQLLTLLLSLAFMRLWEGRNPLQRDDWYWNWLELLGRQAWLVNNPVARLLLAVGVPVLLAAIVIAVIASVSSWLLLPVGIAVLLYSFGREPLEGVVQTYVSACACEDWGLASRQAATLGVNVEANVENSWDSLHQRVLEGAAYRGFERLFAVFFWFLLLGPIGALLYRLSWLYQATGKAPAVAGRWLWLLEWPAVRLLGLSFAITGNFVGCIRRWRECFLCATRSSATVLAESITGALSVDEHLPLSPSLTRHELLALQGLYRRTCWLWLAAWGIWTILH